MERKNKPMLPDLSQQVDLRDAYFASNRNLGWIRISEDLILYYLDYVGGNILESKFSGERRELLLLIEHPSMPISVPGGHAVEIHPIYKRVRRTKKHPTGLVRVD